MYRPKQFNMTDENAMFAVIEENSFATVFSQHEGMPYATHLPLILDREHGLLYGHFARANGQWKDSADQEVLAVFQGPHCYISPTWYETNQAVPTWNYVSVHVYGKVEMLRDPDEIMDVMKKMITNYEGVHEKYQMDELPTQMIDGLLKGIVAFQMRIDRMEGACKLSQHNSSERRARIIAHLNQSEHEAEQQIAKIMEKDLH
ncbi:FMN-binding negative transcriptional regulator [Sporolactobacillus nakayamae]|uniref:Negative transcriptional regulator, PaiB family n=1 Tax=Sporolactobacillus nakayamae TaxID=269670 RepID=A0A1I2PK41_9BACL|nr:FMN-binding negative transcriptional regulator [Sporolactobacillus nakayamae]SFG15489.1 negative transcriptional regulator, PaiB family [Sporolactobacillus nakayamae]